MKFNGWESVTPPSATPLWYLDGKFGIFIHWGPYCVPAFGSEWYPRMMYQQGSAEFEHHRTTHGSHRDFGYKDFIPGLTGERFSAADWMRLFRRAGARYVVPVAEHHDGFAMYDSSFTRWKSTNMGPRRDVLAELREAAAVEGLTFGLSSHRAENWFYFNGGRMFDSDVNDPAFADLYGPAKPFTKHGLIPGVHSQDKLSEPFPDEAFLEDWLARTCELVDRYEPRLVWFDWWIHHVAFEPYLQRFARHFYKRGEEWGAGVAINYKYEAFPEGKAIFDIERGQLDGIRPMFWQTDTSVSRSSWGYTLNQVYKPSAELIGDLADIVSKNGSLLLNVGPKPDGTIPAEEVAILEEIGAWLDVNGEAIYGTRPWKVFGEGPTTIQTGAFTDKQRSPWRGDDIRFTTKGDAIYAIVLGVPEDGVVRIKSLADTPVQSIALLGTDQLLPGKVVESALEIRIPVEVTPRPGFVFKIST
jgi:alpha-L-fucosidase